MLAVSATYDSLLKAHPHAAAVLGPVIRGETDPSHAYLLFGAGAESKTVARLVAGALLARDVTDRDGVLERVMSGVHPDLTWVTPGGAHEMLRRDVDEAVVAAAAHTPFEANYRVFVLEHADALNDEAANSLLKTLEEPPKHVVILLLTNRASELLPTIASRCQHVRLTPAGPVFVAAELEADGVERNNAIACARLSLGDGDAAKQLADGDGRRLREFVVNFARAPIRQVAVAPMRRHGSGRDDSTPTTHTEQDSRSLKNQRAANASAPVHPDCWTALLKYARDCGERTAELIDEQLAAELEYLPRKEHRKKQTEYNDRRRRAVRRTETAAYDQALELIGLWYRDLICINTDAGDLIYNSDYGPELASDAAGCSLSALSQAIDLVDETRMRLRLNVTAELAFEALAFRLRELLAPMS